MTGPRIDVAIGATTQGLDAGFREGIEDAKRFAEKLRAELIARLAQISAAVAQNLLKPEQAAAAGAAAGREFRKALETELETAKKDLNVLHSPTRDGYLSGLSGELAQVTQASGGAGAGLTALRRPITALADSALGVSGPIGNIVSRLGLMAVGGPLIVAAIAGIAAVAFSYETLTHDAQASQKAIDESAKKIENLRNDANSPIQFDVDIQKATKKIDQLLASADRWRRVADALDVNSKAGITGNFGLDALRGAGSVLNAVTFGASGTVLSRFANNKADDKTLEANRLNEGLNEAPGKQLKDEASDLARVITERVADNAQRQRATEIIREQRAEVARLQAIQGGTDAEQRQRTHDIGDAASTAHTLEQALDGVAKKGAAAAKTLEAIANRKQSALDAFTSAIAGETPGTADDFDAKLAKLTDEARKAGLAQATIDASIAKLRAAHGEKIADETRALNASLRSQLVDGLGGAIDAAQRQLQEFDRTIDEQRRKGLTPDEGLVAQVRAQIQALGEAATKAAALKDALATIDTAERSGRGRIQTMRDYLKLLDEAQHDVDTTKAGTKEHTAALERLKAVQAEVERLQKATASDTERAAAAAKLVESGTQHVAGQVAAAASAAAGLATAFLGANSEITRGLSGVAAMATGVEKIAAAATKAGGLGKLLSTGSGLASIIPEIGGIVAGGGAIASAFSALFAKKPPTAAELESQRLLEANTKALYEVASKLGDLALAATGQQRDTAVRAGTEFFSRVQAVPSGTNVSSETILARVLADLGLSFADLAAQGKALGVEITADGHGLAEFLAASDTAGAAFRTLAQDWDVLGTAATDRLAQFLNLLTTIPDTATQHAGAAAKEILANYDLGTQAGRDAAAAYVKQRYAEGAITADVAKEILTLLGDVKVLTPAATEAAAAIDKLAAALSDIADSAKLLGTSDLGQLQEQINAIAEAFPQIGDGLRHALDGVDLSTSAGFATFKDRLRAIFVDLTHNGVAVTDTERKILGSLLGILDSGQQIFGSLQTGAGTVAGAVVAAVGRMIDDVQAEIAKANEGADLLGLSPEDSARFRGTPFNDGGLFLSNGQRAVDVVGMFDFAQPDQRAQALAAARAQYKISTGPDQQFWAQYIRFLTSIPDTVGGPPTAPASAGSVGAGGGAGGPSESNRSVLGGATAGQVSAVDDILRSIFATDREQLDALRGLRTDLAHLFAPLSPIEPPNLPGFGAGGGGDVTEITVTVQLNGPITVGAGVPSDAAAAYVAGTANGVGHAVAADLAVTWNHRALVRGKLSAINGGA